MKIEAVANLISLLATLFIVLGIFGKKKSTIMLWFSLYNVVILITYFMLGRFTGSILVFVTLFKSILFYILAKKNIEPKLWTLIIFEVLYIVIPIFMWDNATDIVLIVNLLLVTYLCWQENLKLLRFGYIISSFLLITYDILVGAYITIIAEVVFLTSTILSMIKAKKDNEKIEAIEENKDLEEKNEESQKLTEN